MLEHSQSHNQISPDKGADQGNSDAAKLNAIASDATNAITQRPRLSRREYATITPTGGDFWDS